MARRGAGTPFLLQLSLLLLLHLGGECGPPRPVPQPQHPQQPAPSGLPGAGRNGGSTAGAGRMGPGTCRWLAQRSALPLQRWGARLREEARPYLLPER